MLRVHTGQNNTLAIVRAIDAEIILLTSSSAGKLYQGDSLGSTNLLDLFPSWEHQDIVSLLQAARDQNHSQLKCKTCLVRSKTKQFVWIEDLHITASLKAYLENLEPTSGDSRCRAQFIEENMLVDLLAIPSSDKKEECQGASRFSRAGPSLEANAPGSTNVGRGRDESKSEGSAFTTKYSRIGEVSRPERGYFKSVESYQSLPTDVQKQDDRVSEGQDGKERLGNVQNEPNETQDDQIVEGKIIVRDCWLNSSTQAAANGVSAVVKMKGVCVGMAANDFKQKNSSQEELSFDDCFDMAATEFSGEEIHARLRAQREASIFKSRDEARRKSYEKKTSSSRKFNVALLDVNQIKPEAGKNGDLLNGVKDGSYSRNGSNLVVKCQGDKSSLSPDKRDETSQESSSEESCGGANWQPKSFSKPSEIAVKKREPATPCSSIGSGADESGWGWFA
jgi:hypothetical protein